MYFNWYVAPEYVSHKPSQKKEKKLSYGPENTILGEYLNMVEKLNKKCSCNDLGVEVLKQGVLIQELGH